MTSTARDRANRKNAKRITGPRAEGRHPGRSRRAGPGVGGGPRGVRRHAHRAADPALRVGHSPRAASGAGRPPRRPVGPRNRARTATATSTQYGGCVGILARWVRSVNAAPGARPDNDHVVMPVIAHVEVLRSCSGRCTACRCGGDTWRRRRGGFRASAGKLGRL
jgi:hypothetical protein